MDSVTKTDTAVVRLVILGIIALGALAMTLSIGGVVALLLLDRKVPDAMWPIAGASFAGLSALPAILSNTRSVTTDANGVPVPPPAAGALPAADAAIEIPPEAQFGSPDVAAPVVDDLPPA